MGWFGFGRSRDDGWYIEGVTHEDMYAGFSQEGDDE
jgi:hypothetical protein